jgi:hypothetical protein
MPAPPLPTPLPIIRAHVRALGLGNAVTIQPGSAEAKAYEWAVGQLEHVTAQDITDSHAVAAAVKRAAELEAALTFYADPASYLTVPAKTQIAADRGARARAALSPEIVNNGV